MLLKDFPGGEHELSFCLFGKNEQPTLRWYLFRDVSVHTATVTAYIEAVTAHLASLVARITALIAHKVAANSHIEAITAHACPSDPNVTIYEK